MTRINRDFPHIVPREIDSDVRFIKFLSLRDLMLIVCLVMVANNFIGAVHSKLQLLYFLFTLIVGIYLIMPAYKDNAQKKVFEVILLIAMKKKSIYYAIEDPIEIKMEGIFADEQTTKDKKTNC